MAARPTMYELLVQNPSNAFAVLSYAIYKQHELEALNAISTATGAAPTQTDIDTLYYATSTPKMLSMYGEQAAALVLFGFRGLDQMLRDFARNSGALASETTQAAKAKPGAPDNGNPPIDQR